MIILTNISNISSPMPSEANTAVVMQPEGKVPVVVFAIGKESAPAFCHVCGNIVDTRVRVSYLICRFLTAILCFYGYVIMLIPLAAVSPCIPILTVENWNGFRLYRHYCPVCGTFLGKYHPKFPGNLKTLKKTLISSHTESTRRLTKKQNRNLPLILS